MREQNSTTASMFTTLLPKTMRPPMVLDDTEQSTDKSSNLSWSKFFRANQNAPRLSPKPTAKKSFEYHEKQERIAQIVKAQELAKRIKIAIDEQTSLPDDLLNSAHETIEASRHHDSGAFTPIIGLLDSLVSTFEQNAPKSRHSGHSLKNPFQLNLRFGAS